MRRPKRFSRATGYGTGRRQRETGIPVSKFISKACPVEEAAPYEAKHTFADFPISEKLKRNIARRSYASPTMIQDEAIPLILQGHDVIGIANTGTGKTAAFLIPLMEKVLQNKEERVLIIAPTRELAWQIQKDFLSFSFSLNMYSALCIGGASMGYQISQLRHAPHFVIGTPGRLKDLVEKECLRLETFGSIVLDEADRMLDMGFIDDIKFLMAKLAAKRQTLLFSATLPFEIERLIRTFLKSPVKVSVKAQDTPAHVEQDVIHAKDREEKIEKLCELLLQKECVKALVFGRTKYGVEKLSHLLIKRGFRAAAIHGNKTQAARQKALDLFKQNRVQALVATDVASRGLDIPNVSHVINFDLPATYEDYIHRIGRTGRANKSGTALTFVD